MRIGIDVVQPDPGPHTTQFARKLGNLRAYLPTVVLMGLIIQVDAIRACVLRDDEQFSHARFDERFRLAQDIVHGSAGKAAAQLRNDAEAAMVIAPF